MPIQGAVGTSLFIIAFVSFSGVLSNLAAGRQPALDVTALFVGGGVIGLFFGARLAIKLPASSLQKVFATGIVSVAIFVASKTLFL